MARLIRKAHHFVLDRRTISRSHALNLAAVQRRTVQICADDFMCFRGCVGQITHRAVVRRVVGLKRKRDDLILTGLLRQIGIID